MGHVTLYKDELLQWSSSRTQYCMPNGIVELPVGTVVEKSYLDRYVFRDRGLAYRQS